VAALVEEVKAWAEGKLTVALMKGDRLEEAERRAVARKLAEYTGLDLDYILGTNLRVDIFRFCKELLRDERRSVGRIDSRFEGVEALAVTEHPEFDASIVAITPPYSAALNHYVRSELGIETDLVYEVMTGKVNEKWQWENGELPATSEEVRAALAKNPYMKVLFAQGYYDLATPLFATEYMISHMNADPKLRGNIEMTYYESGHMFYLEVGCLKAFKDDVARFMKAAL
jgi:carboxypeptidase C (cathepsin A)